MNIINKSFLGFNKDNTIAIFSCRKCDKVKNIPIAGTLKQIKDNITGNFDKILKNKKWLELDDLQKIVWIIDDEKNKIICANCRLEEIEMFILG